MATTKAKRHLHKYRKISKISDRLFTWACAQPNCTHTWPPYQNENIEGKYSECWNCGGQFVLDIEALTMDRPTCLDCRHPERKQLDEIFDLDSFSKLGLK